MASSTQILQAGCCTAGRQRQTAQPARRPLIKAGGCPAPRPAPRVEVDCAVCSATGTAASPLAGQAPSRLATLVATNWFNKLCTTTWVLCWGSPIRFLGLTLLEAAPARRLVNIFSSFRVVLHYRVRVNLKTNTNPRNAKGASDWTKSGNGDP